nr:hypothetical protein [Tanacetum cinerariifolium]
MNNQPFSIVEKWKKTKTAQAKVDSSPHNYIVKEKEAKVLLEYKEAVSDEKLFIKKHTNEDNDIMISEVTNAQIKEALSNISDNKSPGPVGYFVVFFKKAWSIMRQKIGFHGKMVHWIKTCVTTTCFSININGKNHGYFKGGRGLRDLESINVIKQTLQEFGKVSGLVLSLHKSIIFFGSMPFETQQLILANLPFSIGILPVRDLKKKKTKMVNMPGDWEGVVNAMNMQSNANNTKSALRRLVIGAAIYYVWQERNKRTFANETKMLSLLELIFENIRLNLISPKVKSSTHILNVAN